MKRLLALFCLLPVIAFAQTANVTYRFTDFQVNPLKVVRAEQTPLAPFADYNGAILAPYARALATDTNGSVTFSNTVSGYAYRISISTPYGVTTRTCGIPVSVSGNINGRDYLGDFGRNQVFYYLYQTATNIVTSLGYVPLSNYQASVTLASPTLTGNIAANGKLSVSNDVAGRADLGIASLDILGPVGGTNIHLGNDGITSLQPITYNNVLVQPGQFATFDGNKRIVGTNDVPASYLTGTVPLANLTGITSNQLDAATWQLATNAASAALSGNGANVSNTVNASSVASGVTNQWRTEISTATNNPALAFTNKTQTFYSPLTLASGLTVLDPYSGAGRQMQFNGATAPAYDYYAEVMRVLMHGSTLRWSLLEGASGNFYPVLSYFPSTRYLYVSNTIGTMEYYGKGHALDSATVNPQAIAQLLPKPYVQFALADWDGGTYESTQLLFTNTVQLLKTNGFMAVMTNMGITPIVLIDENWTGTNRNYSGGYLTNDDKGRFPNSMAFLANYAHTNGMNFGLSIYFATNNVPGTTRTISVNYGSHFQEVMMTADSIQKDVLWFYTNGVDSLRMQDIQFDYHYMSELARGIGCAALAPYNGNAWNLTDYNQNLLTNARPMAIAALVGEWPPPADLWQGVNVVSWDAGWPISPINFRNSTGTRWMFTNMVPMMSVGHYFEAHFASDTGTAAGNRHYLSQLAMMSQSLLIKNINSSPPFGSSTWQAFVQNTNMLSIQQDVGGVPEFKIRRIFDGGTGQTMAFAKTLTGQNRAAVWLINDTAGNVNMGVTMAQLGLDPSFNYSVTNVWNNTNGGSYYVGFTNLVQANDCALFILDRTAEKAPVFYTAITAAPTPAMIGAGNGVNWVSNGFLYYSYTADGTTSNNAVKIAP